MSKVFKYQDWRRRKIAIIHMPGSTNELAAAFSMLDLPHILYEGDDPDLESKFSDDSDSICGISIGGGYIKPNTLIPDLPDSILDFPTPKLGICLGNEILGQYLGAKLINCNPPAGEYGEVIAKLMPNLLFEGLPDLPGKYPVRMYHIKMLESNPPESQIIASTRLTNVAGFYHPELKTWGLQFHPEKDWLNTLVVKNFYRFCLSSVEDNFLKHQEE